MAIVNFRTVLIVWMMIPHLSIAQSNPFPKVLKEEAKNDFIASHYRDLAGEAFNKWHHTVDKKEWLEERERLRELVIDRSGMKCYPDLPLEMQETGSILQEGYTVKNIYFQSSPGVYVTANVYVPAGEGPFPAVVVSHGHWPDGRRSEIFQSVAQSLVQAGYVALTLDAWGAGERCTVTDIQEYHGANLGASLLNVGETLLGMQLTDNIRAVDLLCSLSEVDSSRIGATGASGGGNQAMWLAAMDERIKVAIPVVSVGTFQSYVMNSNCVCELLPYGLAFTEESAILGLIAPRALKVFSADKDTNPAFFPSEMLRSVAHAKPLFAEMKSEGKLSFELFDTGHGYWPEMRLSMLNWFDKELKGTEEQQKEGLIKPLDATKLATFKVNERDRKVITTAAFCREEGSALNDSLLRLSSLSLTEKLNELEEIVGKREGREVCDVKIFGEEGGWQKRALVTRQQQYIPFLSKSQKKASGNYRIFMHSSGKDSIPAKAVQKAIDEGEHVILLDVWGTGEQCSAEAKKIDGQLPDFHTLSRSALWLGRTVMGEWLQDLEAVASWIGQEGGEISGIEAHKETAIAALIFSTRYRVSSLALYNCPYSYRFDEREGIDFYNMAIHLPGILKWGDVSLMAALSTSKINFFDARSMSGRILENGRQQALTKEIANYCRKLNKKIQTTYWTE